MSYFEHSGKFLRAQQRLYQLMLQVVVAYDPDGSKKVLGTIIGWLVLSPEPELPDLGHTVVTTTLDLEFLNRRKIVPLPLLRLILDDVWQNVSTLLPIEQEADHLAANVGEDVALWVLYFLFQSTYVIHIDSRKKKIQQKYLFSFASPPASSVPIGSPVLPGQATIENSSQLPLESSRKGGKGRVVGSRAGMAP